MKKILCIIAAMALLLGAIGLFSGCKRDEEKPKTPIIQNGATGYIILYPEVPTANESEAVRLLKDKIKDVTDVRLKSISEEFKDEEPDASVIYIGNTAFEPAVQAKARISAEHFDAYEIDMVDEDIYIVAASDTALLAAVQHFVDELIDKNYDAETATLYFEGCHFDGEIAFPTGFSVQNIREYSIIYDADGLNMQPMAKKLQTVIKDSTGYAPDIYKDTEKTETTFEILLGETDRSLSERCYEKKSRIMEYEYVVDGCKLQLAFGGCFSGEKCIDDISFRILRNKDEYLQSGNYHKNELAKTEQALTSGADVRIMSANILAYRWGEANYKNVLPAAQRAEIFAGVLLRYRPDAVGLQETDQPWQQSLPWYLERMAEKDGIEYSFLFDKLSEGSKTMVNFSTIAYRSDIYELDEKGSEIFSIWEMTPSYFQRVATWVKLTCKTDSTKQFALVNTHWAHEDHDTVNACAVEQAALVNTLKAKYEGITVFCTGDYNNLDTREWKDKYVDQLVSDINGSIASSVAKKNGVLITPGGCRGSAKNMAENLGRDVDNDFIDHIILSGAACEVKRHDTIRENKCNVLSDHSPIYADIDLK